MASAFAQEPGWATETYSAPEYKLRRKGSVRSELFSIAVVVYERLTGAHPYGERYENCQSFNDLYRLRYQPAHELNPMVPVWMDGALKKALQVSADLRYESLSEFVWDLRHPNPAFLDKSNIPLAFRNPLRFWQVTSAVLVLTQLVSLWWILS
jgi:serine/threonine protein kinase